MPKRLRNREAAMSERGGLARGLAKDLYDMDEGDVEELFDGPGGEDE